MFDGAGGDHEFAELPRTWVSRTTSIAVGLAITTVAFVALLGAEPYSGEPPASAPGKVASTHVAEICAVTDGMTYSQSHRVTSSKLKRQIFLRDLGRIPTGRERRTWEIDHRVPLCLGGADEAANLWAQRSFHGKDDDEAYACRAVCDGNLPISTAQDCFLGDLKNLTQCLGRE